METTERRWVGSGWSDDPDAFTAGQTAARGALTGDLPGLVIVFASPSLDLTRLHAGIVEVVGDTPIVGCTSSGEIATGRAGATSVAVMALGGPGFDFVVRHVEGIDGDLRGAGQEVAAAGDEVEGEHRILMLLSDGLAGNQQDVVRGAYRRLGARVPLVGGCAGDDLAMDQTFQFVAGRIVTDSLIGVGIGSDAPIGVGVRHGWRAVGEPMFVTIGGATEVVSLDGRPAAEAYLEFLGADPELLQDESAFAAFALTHPLGLAGRSDEHIRFIAGADPATGVLRTIAEVPEGVPVWVMEGDVASVMDGTRAACLEALEGLGGAQPKGLLAFDCVARQAVLGTGVAQEVALISETAPGAELVGFYTYGEFARTAGVNGFHNQTLVVLALA